MLIYCIHNTVNNKCYIGQTTQSFHRRRIGHSYNLRHGIHNYKLQKDYDKYGENSFEWCVLEKHDSIDELNDAEQFWIGYFSSHLTGYNIDFGGGGFELSDVSKRKQNGCYNIPVCKYSLKGELLDVYDSITEAANDVGCAINTLIVCLQGKTKTAYNFQWRYLDDDICKLKEVKSANARKGKPKKVAQYDLNGNFIRTFKSKYEAAEVVERHPKMIGAACRQQERCDTAADSQWRYFKNKPRRKISATKSGQQKIIEKNSKAVGKFDLDGNLLEIYDSSKLAGEDNDLYHNTIRLVANGHYYKDNAGGFKWKYLEN